MKNSFKKECYDANPHFKVHYSHGLTSQNLAMSYLHYDKDMIIEYYRKGEASIHIEGNLYSIAEEDIVILNPDELHVSTMKEQCYIEKIVLHISRSLFDLFSNDLDYDFITDITIDKLTEELYENAKARVLEM